MTPKQWFALVVALVVIAAAAGGLEDTMRQEFNPVWDGNK